MRDTPAWRLLDTGARSAAENIALDRVLLDTRSKEEAPSTLRFLSFSSPAALIGRHQTVGQEIRTEFCRENGIDINRRITGGGAVFFDTTQVGWEVIALRRQILGGTSPERLTESICRGVVAAFQLLGIDASYRPRNDIEVRGRKISGTGGIFEGEAVLFQGTLLVDFDAETMIRALKVPTEKLTSHELDSARDRVTCLAELLPETPPHRLIKEALAEGLSRQLAVEFKPGDLLPGEEAMLNRRLPFFQADAWVNQICEPPEDHQALKSIHHGEGGMVRSALCVDIRRKRIKKAIFTGDFFINPPRAVFDLEARLKDTPFEKAREAINEFFKETRPQALGIDSDDFWQSLRGSLKKLDFPDCGISLEEANHVSVVGSADLERAAAGAGVLLLPYCAKLPDCEYRRRDGCDICGDCSIGDAYALAAERDIPAVTVHSYEHLKEIFAVCRQAGVTSFIGCCCQAFLIKRHRVFSTSGLSGVIIDIEDATCYELAKEKEAYQGRFENQTSLRLKLLKKVIALAPPREGSVPLDLSKISSG